MSSALLDRDLDRTDPRNYALGYSAGEFKRLEDQAAFYHDLTEDLLRRAGIGSGIRVLDIGAELATCRCSSVVLSVPKARCSELIVRKRPCKRRTAAPKLPDRAGCASLQPKLQRSIRPRSSTL